MNESLERTRYLEQLQAIHGLRDKLQLEGEAYRGLLERLTGSRSSKLMTPEQRRRVIAFLRVADALETAHEALEEARDALHADTPRHDDATLPKRVVVDGVPVGTMRSTLEEVLAAVRSAHGSGARLAGVSEGEGGLELRFETPLVLDRAA